MKLIHAHVPNEWNLILCQPPFLLPLLPILLFRCLPDMCWAMSIDKIASPHWTFTVGTHPSHNSVSLGSLMSVWWPHVEQWCQWWAHRHRFQTEIVCHSVAFAVVSWEWLIRFHALDQSRPNHTHTHSTQHSVTSMPQICHLIFDSRVPVCAISKPQIGMLSVCGQCK